MAKSSGGGGRSGRGGGGIGGGFRRNDFVRTDTGLRGIVLGAGQLGSARNPIAAVRLDIGGGRTSVVPLSALSLIAR